LEELSQVPRTPVVRFQTICLKCGFIAHMLSGEKVVLLPTYLADYVVPVLLMACPMCGYQTFQTEAFVPKPGLDVSRETSGADNSVRLLQEPESSMIPLLPGGFASEDEQRYWNDRGVHSISGTNPIHDAGYFTQYSDGSEEFNLKERESDGTEQ
jgi:hypothetical protein